MKGTTKSIVIIVILIIVSVANAFCQSAYDTSYEYDVLTWENKDYSTQQKGRLVLTPSEVSINIFVEYGGFTLSTQCTELDEGVFVASEGGLIIYLFLKDDNKALDRMWIVNGDHTQNFVDADIIIGE